MDGRFVDTKSMRPTYTARVLWHCPGLERWELETQHPGFASPVAAAYFANAETPGPESLILIGGTLIVLLSDETEQHLTSEVVQAWRLPDGIPDFHVAHDADYEKVAASIPELAALGLTGIWHPVGYVVTGPSGVVDVDLQRDEEGRIEAVLVDHRPDEDLEPDAPVLAVIPRA